MRSALFTGVHPIIFRQPKQLLSQSAAFVIIDGPMCIIFDEGDAFCSFPDCWTTKLDDDTTKLSTFDDDIDDGGAKAEDDRIGRTAAPLLPFVFTSFASSPFSFPNPVLLSISSSPNSANGRTGNK